MFKDIKTLPQIVTGNGEKEGGGERGGGIKETQGTNLLHVHYVCYLSWCRINVVN